MSDPMNGQMGGYRAVEDKEFVIRIPTFDRILRSMLPSDAVGHIRAAEREGLLAVRSVIDAAVKDLERSDEEERRTRRRVEIAVE